MNTVKNEPQNNTNVQFVCCFDNDSCLNHFVKVLQISSTQRGNYTSSLGLTQTTKSKPFRIPCFDKEILSNQFDQIVADKINLYDDCIQSYFCSALNGISSTIISFGPSEQQAKKCFLGIMNLKIKVCYKRV